MKKSFLTFAVFHLTSYIIFSQPAFITDSLDKFMEREMKRWNVPGMAIAIVKDGKVVVSKGYGVRDASKPDKVDENTLFQIASNSKAFTATSVALLDHQKRLSLDDKITKWIPDFKLYDTLATREATLRDMLCHRIGFQTFQSDFLNWGCNLTRKEIIERMRTVKPVYSFRSKYGYCNSAFLTAGEIIPIVTDTSWDDYLKYHFFIPLKMSRTSTDWKSITSDNNACKAHTIVDNKLVIVPTVNVDNFGPAASINSSVKDLSNWLLMQLDSGKFEGKEVIPFDVLQKTRASHMIVSDMNPNFGSNFQVYGLGWFMLDYNGKRIIRHDGGANGFVTTTCFVPSMKLGMVILSNTDANNLYASMRTQIIDAYLNLPYSNHSERIFKAVNANMQIENAEINKLKETASKKPKPALKQEEYTGSYTNEVYGKISIKQVNNMLTIYFSHHPNMTAKLEPLGENDFLCTYSDPIYGIKKISFKAKDGKTQSVTLKVNDFVDYMEYEFKKEK